MMERDACTGSPKQKVRLITIIIRIHAYSQFLISLQMGKEQRHPHYQPCTHVLLREHRQNERMCR